MTLTALCALLAALAIIAGAAGFFGYYGLKKQVKDAIDELKADVKKDVIKVADNILDKKFSEYPDSKEVVTLFNEMRDLHARQKELSSQLLTPSASKTIARASKTVQDKGKGTGPFAKDYPGKGK